MDGGAEGSRTPDLLIANETLYQLSYDPIQFIIMHLRRIFQTLKKLLSRPFCRLHVA